jgi:predicted transposase/invertase (TIGR01784 family)
MFDTVCKFLVETFSADFAAWLLGAPIALTELSPAELSLEPIRADALILLQSPDTILHLEFQARPDPTMVFRMIDYRLRVYRRFPHKAMRQVVIYLTPSQSEAVYQTTFAVPGTRHEFEIVRLWEQPSARFLNQPGLLPLAPLTQTEDPAQLLRQVATEIDSIGDRRTQSNVAASAAILAGLVLDKDLIQQILRREMMQESVIYQDIKAEGWQEGRQEGRQEGLQEGLQEGRQEGLQEGRQEGRRQEALALVLRLLSRRVGVLPEATRSAVVTLSLAQIESLGEALLEFTDRSDLQTWLTQQQQQLAATVQQLTTQLGTLSPQSVAAVQALSVEQWAELQAVLAEWTDESDLVGWLQAQAENDGLEHYLEHYWSLD